MSLYSTILIAVDLHPACDDVVASRAIEVAKQNQSKVAIIHAVEHLNAYGAAQAYPAVLDLEEQLVSEAKAQLKKLSSQYGIPSELQFVEIGSPKAAILECAEKLKADLIVVGSHGRHGFSLLLGSTANAVLHHAQRDVLAVSIKA